MKVKLNGDRVTYFLHGNELGEYYPLGSVARRSIDSGDVECSARRR